MDSLGSDNGIAKFVEEGGHPSWPDDGSEGAPHHCRCLNKKRRSHSAASDGGNVGNCRNTNKNTLRNPSCLEHSWNNDVGYNAGTAWDTVNKKRRSHSAASDGGNVGNCRNTNKNTLRNPSCLEHSWNNDVGYNAGTAWDTVLPNVAETANVIAGRSSRITIQTIAMAGSALKTTH